MPARLLAPAVLALALLMLPSAHAQPTPSQQVSALAPQLQAFAGSQANFDALSTALVQGGAATLQTTTADGVLQTVTISPQAPMAPLAAAQTLEAARQLLISRGIATPTAEQIGVALMGGPLTTPLGTFRTNGVLSGNVNPAALTVERQAASAPFGGSTANFQSLTQGLTQGRPITLTSVTPTGAAQTASFIVPGAPLSQAEAAQALQLAAQLLASQGITNPTPQQIQVALLGGTLVNGATGVALQGVLQGRGSATGASIAGRTVAPGFTSASPIAGNTSDSPLPRTSDSPVAPGTTSASPLAPGATSASPATTTSSAPVPGTVAGPNGAPSPAAQMQRR